MLLCVTVAAVRGSTWRVARLRWGLEAPVAWALAGSSDRFEPRSYATILHDVLRQRLAVLRALLFADGDISATVRAIGSLMAALARRPPHTDLAHQIGLPG